MGYPSFDGNVELRDVRRMKLDMRSFIGQVLYASSREAEDNVCFILMLNFVWQAFLNVSFDVSRQG